MSYKFFKKLVVKLLLTQNISSFFLSRYIQKRESYTPLSQNHFGPNYHGTRNLDESFVASDTNSSQAYENWKILIANKIISGQNFVALKFGDGDHYFLTKQEVGSAKPGKRALSVSYSEIDMRPFEAGMEQADLIACESVPTNLRNLELLRKGKGADFPAEFIYASVANRWLTKTFQGNLGIIGASEKIDLIESLLEHNSYRGYLGILGEVKLVRIPQKFACDNLGKTIELITGQLDIAGNRTYLMGIGHVKFGLVEALKNYENSQFLDIGSGIDALAGVIDVRRPYFADWTNFRFSNPDSYSKIDLLQATNFGKSLLIPGSQ
jgi:hypothetical protein